MGLKLIANDTDDLKVMAGTLQDAIIRVGDIALDMPQRSLTLRASRFRHENARPERIESGLRIDNVMEMRSQGIDRTEPDAFLVLLNASFEPTDEPSGKLTLTFAGGGRLQVDVEALDIILADIGDPRRTRHRPDHDLL